MCSRAFLFLAYGKLEMISYSLRTADVEHLLDFVNYADHEFFVQDIPDGLAYENSQEAWEYVLFSAGLLGFLERKRNLFPLRDLALMAACDDGLLIDDEPKLLPGNIVERNPRIVDYLRIAKTFTILGNVASHREMLTVSYDIVDEFIADCRRDVAWASKQFRDLLAIEIGDSTKASVTESERTDNDTLAAAFSCVAEFFRDRPEVVLEIIANNNGTIRLTRLRRYEAACILNPLRQHFTRNKRNTYRVKIEIQGESLIYWLRDRYLHFSYQDAKGKANHWQQFSALETQFLKSLQKHEVKLPQRDHYDW